jgi:microcystin-dependent protein
VTQPFLGQIQSFGFGFAPRNWALCQGQILSIQQNTALFSLLGTNFGGNGTTNFALPNLQSRVPVHQGTLSGGSDYFQGETAGVENVTLLSTQMPLHNHAAIGTQTPANFEEPTSGTVLAQSTRQGGVSPGDAFYGPSDANTIAINPLTISMVGNSMSHTNIQPYLTINWCIALAGVYPSRS